MENSQVKYKWRAKGLVIGILCLGAFLLMIDFYTKWTFQIEAKEFYQASVLETPASIFKERKQQEDSELEVVVSIRDIKGTTLVPRYRAPRLADVKGAIYIPDLQIQLPILSGTSVVHVKRGATLLQGSTDISDTNVVLGAISTRHNNILFGALARAEDGMEIYITDKEGIGYYKVTKRLLVRSGREDVLLEGDVPSLSLVTSVGAEGKEQLVIKAERVMWEVYESTQLGNYLDIFGY